jgi:hypothetical protein
VFGTTSSASIHHYVSVSFIGQAHEVIETKQMDVGSKKIYSVQFKIIGIRKSFVRI